MKVEEIAEAVAKLLSKQTLSASRQAIEGGPIPFPSLSQASAVLYCAT